MYEGKYLYSILMLSSDKLNHIVGRMSAMRLLVCGVLLLVTLCKSNHEIRAKPHKIELSFNNIASQKACTKSTVIIDLDRLHGSTVFRLICIPAGLGWNKLILFSGVKFKI